MGIFPAREGKREKKRETVELCQLLAHRALPELGQDLSVFAARLCLWCKVMGTHMEKNAQKYKTAESKKCKALYLFHLIPRTGNLMKPPISGNE